MIKNGVYCQEQTNTVEENVTIEVAAAKLRGLCSYFFYYPTNYGCCPDTISRIDTVLLTSAESAYFKFNDDYKIKLGNV